MPGNKKILQWYRVILLPHSTHDDEGILDVVTNAILYWFLEDYQRLTCKGASRLLKLIFSFGIPLIRYL
jgi:hypothetical protein